MRKPIYIEVAEKLMTEITIQKLKPNSKVPSVRQTALNYNVNPKTVQKAYAYLDELGFFYTEKGQGRYLSKDHSIVSKSQEALFEVEIRSLIKKLIENEIEIDFILKIIKEMYEQDTTKSEWCLSNKS